VRGVKIAVKYPVLMPSFPRSSEYLEFYRRVARELRRRNLKFLMQMTDGFRETAFSALPVEPYYRGLTWERYRREKREMADHHSRTPARLPHRAERAGHAGAQYRPAHDRAARNMAADPPRPTLTGQTLQRLIKP
jgi:hypothetical protein